MPNWFEDTQFWIDFFPVMFPEERITRAPEEVDAVLTLTNARQGPILDLSCGPGRHAVAFAARGYAVTGVDLSAYLLEKAEERAEEAQVQVELVREDMRTFVRPGAFRLAVNLFTSFGYFEDREEDLRVLQNVYRSLKEGGVFVIDIIGKEALARVFQPAGVRELEEGLMFFEKREILDDWSRIRATWVLVREERAKRHTFELNLYSAQELKGALRNTGFREVSVYGDLEGHPYGVDAPRLVAVAVK